MNDLVRQHTALGDSDLEWLHLLVSEWQLLSDLSFADLVLWVPTRDGTRYVSVAQMRPNTGPTSYQDDMVGHLVPRGRRPCWTSRSTRAGSCARATRSGVRRFPYGSSPFPYDGRGASSVSSPATPTSSPCAPRADWS